MVAYLVAVAGAAIVTAAGVDAATTYPNLTVSPGGGQAGATFSATYRAKAGTGCVTNTIVVIRWNAPNGAKLGAIASSASCSTTFNNNLRPPGSATPGKFTLWALRTDLTGNELNGTSTRASVPYTVNNPPSPPPPSPSPPRPTPTPPPTPTPMRAPTPAPPPTSTTAATTTNRPTQAPVALAIKPDPSRPPMAAASTDAPPAPAPPEAAPEATSTTCKGAACSASHHPAASPSIVAAVRSLVGRSPLPVVGIVLLAVAGVLYAVMRRTEGPRPLAASAAVARRAPDPAALDPVTPDPAQREIYRPPVPEPLPIDQRVVGRPSAQVTEDILPMALFPPADETGVIKPPPATEDGLPPVAPRPPQR